MRMFTIILFITSFWNSAISCELPYVMKFAPDLHTQPVETLLSEISETPINIISTTISWDVVEPEDGKVSLTPYFEKLEMLVKAGYCLNIIIDTSGRWKLNESGEPEPGGSIPGWLDTSLGYNPYSFDFFGNSPGSTLSFSDKQALSRVRQFYSEVLKNLKDNFSGNIAFITVGAAPELEAKYSQNAYAFQDYSTSAEAAYSIFRDRIGLGQASQPKLDYAQHFGGGAPKFHVDRDKWMQFRRMTLAHYFCTLSREIRAAGFAAFAYFGGPFQSHDAIYATNAIDDMTSCFDGIAIDHNFYNGYRIDIDGSYVGTILSYVVNAGFERIVIGLYAERLLIHGFSNSQIENVFLDALATVTPSRAIVGLEIGGLQSNVPGQLAQVYSQRLVERLNHIQSSVGASNRLPIALLASETSFELWQGDNAYGRAIHQEALRDTFQLLQGREELDVHVVSESVLARNVASYAGIFLPHVTAPSDHLVETVQLAAALGIGVIQDVRFAEFRPNGSKRDNSARRLFGISAAAWRESEFDVMWYDTKQVGVTRAPNSYAAGLVMTGEDGFTIAAHTRDDEKTGLMLQGRDTLALGFLLVDASEELRRLAGDAIVSFLRRR